MSDTPETDKLAGDYSDLPNMADAAIWPHARRLERERDEARATITDMEMRHAAVMLHTQTVVDEANAYKAQRDRLVDHIGKTIEAVEQFANDPNTDDDHRMAIHLIAEDLKIALAAGKGGSDA